ncbi:dTDP-glucose pyrophosphorylase [Haloplanus salinus]|uniref:dTDP-glucose pyrophosphorylase n=1 Tax=Haloplanus salinus TaxID=1126245 RepID=A0A368NBQ2_9EURY|nr:sugar phosphate nucleotidyltransferase [Haloplanus salinus]RCU48007.1 dTDP-glucose pyrophosphorylase [Haloplanus salinus]
MKAVIPAAGRGTRLFPQTHTKPKPMVRVAGKPILGHILDGVVDSPIDEVVVVVGVMRDHVVEYVTAEYSDDLDVAFAEQETTEGLGHCIYQTREYVGDESMCILLGDMLFETDLGAFLDAHDALGDVDGSIGVKRVDEPSNYGIVTMDGDRIAGLVEKPADPPSNLAISGVYVVEDSAGLFDALGALIENDVRGAGDEYQLTDGLQRMLDAGATFGTFEVRDWYDCGRPETLLEANRVLLESAGSTDGGVADSSVLIPPVDVGEGALIEHSVVGPYVSIDDGARIEDSRVKDSIVGRGSQLRDVNLAGTLVGSGSEVTGTPSRLNVGDSSEIHL